MINPIVVSILQQTEPSVIALYINEKGDFEEWLEANRDTIAADAKTAELQAKVDIGKLAEIELAKEVKEAVK